jgi:proteasome accessory factor B
MHDSIRTFKISRIIKLEILEKCFVDEEKFDLSEYIGRAWSMIPEGKIYRVKLQFLPKVARNVTEVRWHSTQQVEHNPDGSATVEFRVDGLGEIYWWLLGYGDQVRILAPKTLRDKILAAAKNIIKLNENL